MVCMQGTDASTSDTKEAVCRVNLSIIETN
jgi:hypothetical protein